MNSTRAIAEKISAIQHRKQQVWRRYQATNQYAEARLRYLELADRELKDLFKQLHKKAGKFV